MIARFLEYLWWVGRDEPLGISLVIVVAIVAGCAILVWQHETRKYQ